MSGMTLVCLVQLWPVEPGWAESVVRVRGPVVVAGHTEATKAGVEVLRNGGNAVDALVAVSTALGVTEPGNSGLGGKLLVLYFEAATGKVTFVTALNAAPRKLDVTAAIAMPSVQKNRGWTSACVPGLVAGLGTVHEKWGSKPWAELLKPAIGLARGGYVLTERTADMGSEFPLKVGGKASDENAVAIYAPGGKHMKAGERAGNADLARTLEGIAGSGWRSFYTGVPAAKMIAAANAAGMPFSHEDFVDYKPRVTSALKFEYKGRTIYTSPAPLSGGAILAATMKVLEPVNLKATGGSSRDAACVDALSRALTQVYPAATAVAGDRADSEEKVAAMLSEDSIRKLATEAASVEAEKLKREADPAGPDRPAETSSRDPAFLPEFMQFGDDGAEACTTHLAIVDSAGNIVVATQSLGWHFGSVVVAPGTGVLMNNDMSNFSFNSPNGVNQVEAGKWPRSTITPTLVLKDGKPVLAIGSPGGQRIPVQVAQVLLDVLEFDKPLPEAVNAPRFHLRRATTQKESQNVIDVESTFEDGIETRLGQHGWNTVRTKPGSYYYGSVNSILIEPGGWHTAVADPRRSADAGGLNVTD